MKRVLILLFLCGLFLNIQAVNITVIRLTGNAKEVQQVNAIQFLPGQTIKCQLSNGESTELTGVRKISFENNDFTAIEDVTTPSTIRVYPNPTADMLIIDGAAAKQEIAIYSLNGSKVLSAQSQEGTNTIQVSELPNGVYLLLLSNETFKLIKE
jgi:hypothetical protein